MEKNMTITTQTILASLAAGIQKANDINSPSSIAIVDSGRNLLGYIRMDGALLASIEISQGKAYTSSSMNMKTGDIMELIQPGGPLYGMEVSHDKPFIAFGGGIPITKEGNVIGAVGVAGGMPSDDEAIAQAAADVINN
jgi:uncharacterized protein GlcG (DUF336 family)